MSRRLQLAGVALVSAGVTAGVILSIQKLIRRERVRKLKESIPSGDGRVEERVSTTPTLQLQAHFISVNRVGCRLRNISN
jgi:hypothetical protein